VLPVVEGAPELPAVLLPVAVVALLAAATVTG